MDILHILQQLERKQVTLVRLAGNSLILYLDCKPGDKNNGSILWLEPTWHFRSSEMIISGSREAQTDDETEHNTIADKLNRLVYKSIDYIIVETGSNDLIIKFDDDLFLKTFVSNPTDEKSWSITDNVQKIKIIGNPKEIKLRIF